MQRKDGHTSHPYKERNVLIFNLVIDKRNRMSLTTVAPLQPRNCSRLDDYLDFFILHLHRMGIENFPFWENLLFFKDFSMFFRNFSLLFSYIFQKTFFVFLDIFLSFFKDFSWFFKDFFFKEIFLCFGCWRRHSQCRLRRDILKNMKNTPNENMENKPLLWFSK